MTTTSKREQIIEYAVSLIDELDSIKTVERVMQNYSDLENFADTQIPVAAVVGGLPIPVPKMSSKGMSDVDLIISDMVIKIRVYGLDRVNPDTLVSNLADDVWAKLYSDQQFGEGRAGLILGLTLAFDGDPQYWEPYVAFQTNCTVRYKHNRGGI